MRSSLHVATLFAAAAFTPIAHADSPTDFTITGTNTATTSPYTISFSLDPANATPEYNDFSFFNVNASINSVPDTVIVEFSQTNEGNLLHIQEPNDGTYFESDLYQPNGGTQFFSGSGLTSTIPTFNDGSYHGKNFISCQDDVSTVRTPQSMFPTAALLQLPVITTSCGEAVTLTETTTSTGPSGPTVTPEPSSLALFGTGALGVVGVLRRRFSL